MTPNPLTPQAAASVPPAAPGPSVQNQIRNPFSWTTWLLLAAALALLAGASARWVDLPLAIWIKQSVSAGVNESFEWVGELGESGPYIGVALAFYVVGLIGLARGWRNPLRMSYSSMARGSLLMLSTMAVGGVVVLLLKRSVARARPELFFEKGIYGLGESFSRAQQFNSFPSSHTYAAFAVAVVLSILAPRWRVVFLLLAALVAMSRLVNLDHYLSDVMTAAGIAVLVGHLLAPRVLGSQYQWPLRAPWRWWKKA
ncbi:acid phosphatase [Achromobacter spanius]|uniref:Acid phosphatase n=2 Tax=Achromobacter TaxID=222 RepID=A0A2S5GJ40_9BURK|nr:MULTISPECIES: phosphatase PAP2 family protein [Achromobacter]PPA73080.1 acid phosphatase [Achromobacter spanius]QYJ20500.1 phosphatase PAP2 family protein [Achromobacter sp. ES-001]HCQ48690.1 phosphatase PAP2 family protein [Achromobacter sp.]